MLQHQQHPPYSGTGNADVRTWTFRSTAKNASKAEYDGAFILLHYLHNAHVDVTLHAVNQ